MVNQRVATALLKRLGFETDTAANGEEALQLVQTNHSGYDVILMDCQMPRLSGADATRQIRTHHDASALPIVALTATAVATERDTCIAAGMNDFLTKPLRPERLSALLAHIRGGR